MAVMASSALVYGYGNPGRGDDGLGPALAAAVESLGCAQTTVESNYQLELQDAAELGRHDVVIFADADLSGPEPFWFQRVEPTARVGFTSHSVTPGALLALAGELFGSTTQAYALGIRGYEFDDLREVLSPRAQENLDQAVIFVKRALEDRKFEHYVQQYGIGSGRAGQAESGQNEGERQ
jgi:hydrogenase maturation protease